jgi:hypothetical protein
LQAHFTDNYGEKAERLNRFAALVKKTNDLYAQMPPAKRDAFYETVVYPIRCSALLNERWLANDPAQAAKAYDQIQSETKYFNTQLAGGKWANMMSAAPHSLPVFQKPATSPAPVSTSILALSGSGEVFSFSAPMGASVGPAWKIISGLGRSESSITLWPATAPVPSNAALKYNFTALKSGPAHVQVYCIPTHSIYPGLQLRYSAAMDNESPQVVNLDTEEFSHPWSDNVLRAAAIGATTHNLSPGPHTLIIRPLDPGVVFDKVVINLGGLKPSQTGPPETNP